MFVTLCIGVLDLSSGLMNYSNAGHNPPLLLADSDVKILPCDPNIPAGVLPGWQYTDQHLQLKTGDSLFLYTDGLNEAEDPTHAQFGVQRIIRIAESLVKEGKNDPTTITNQMIEGVHRFVDDAEQSDDMTILAIRYGKRR
jgi:sigma-B regulation protein RsbU (phosphoserine phosphatase)